jgi:hypothetical protein
LTARLFEAPKANKSQTPVSGVKTVDSTELNDSIMTIHSSVYLVDPEKKKAMISLFLTEVRRKEMMV